MQLIMTCEALKKAFAEQYKIPDTDVRVNYQGMYNYYNVDVFEITEDVVTKKTSFEVKIESTLIDEVKY